jgi:ribosomal protein S18 acetylase RimI-like enzyme
MPRVAPAPDLDPARLTRRAADLDPARTPRRAADLDPARTPRRAADLDPARTPRVVPAAGHDLARLTPLAEAIFAADAAPAGAPAEPPPLLGAPRRAPGWFRRKLAREAVDPQLSSLVLGTGDEPVGYMLVGAGDPDTGEVHGAGLGLVPAHRGRGLGSALVEATCERLALAGISAISLLADPDHHGFYRRRGFFEVAQQHTLGALGTGAADLEFAAHPRRPWPLPGTTHAQWSAATWARTPAGQSATVRLGESAWAHLSREGRAVLVHRLSAHGDGDVDVNDADDADDADLPAALHRLRDLFGPATPVLLHGCAPVSPVTASGLAAGWQVLQHAHVMQRRFW